MKDPFPEMSESDAKRSEQPNERELARNERRLPRNRLFQILFFASVMGILRLVVPHVPFPVTWLIHFLFAFALTRLVCTNLMKGQHARRFLLVTAGLMAFYEIYWWFMGDKISGSIPLTAFDSVMDLGAGIAGILVGIRAPQSRWG